MCGIAGLWHLDDRPVDSGALRAMGEAIGHRGPDAHGLHAEGPVGLVHARLRIIDLSEAGTQPMANEDRTVWVMLNGEIYNYRPLRDELIQRGHTFRSQSDTEVIVHLYEELGAQSIERLDGMFAIAVWDSRRRRLLLARDRVGKKPLFYVSTADTVAFASEIKALFRAPLVRPEIDPAVLPAFFLYGYVPTPRTFYRGVHALPPGHFLEVTSDGRQRLEPYWDVSLSQGSNGRAPSDAEAAARVRELVTAAVQKRLVADVPLGAFLSGGLDSSIVVGVMSQLLQGEPVRTFSIGFSGDARYDETAYARLVSARFRTVHTEFVVEPSTVELVERLVWHHDGPFADSSAIPTYLLSRLTRQHVTVALTGDGGDELFAGYLRFYATLLSERVPQPIREAAQRLLSGLPEWGSARGPFRRLQKFARKSSLPFLERFTCWNAVFYEDLPRLLPGVSIEGSSPASVLALLDPYVRRGAHASPLNRLLYLNLKTYLLDDLLVKMDRCSMAHALEARSPFLDRELLEYVFALPDAMKLHGGQTKTILRKAFADLLPPTILRRGKMGFSIPLQAWFTKDLRAYLHDLLLSPTACLRAYLDQSYVRSLYDAHMTGRVDHASRLWTLLTFEVWLRQLPSWSASEHDATAGALR